MSRRTVASAFAFARKLMEVRAPQALTLQAEFIQAQLQAMARQMRDLGKTTTLMGTANMLTESAPSS
jgi:hypothetical protein